MVFVSLVDGSRRGRGRSISFCFKLLMLIRVIRSVGNSNKYISNVRGCLIVIQFCSERRM